MKSRAKWTATGGKQKRHWVRNTIVALLAFVVGFTIMLGALYWANRSKSTPKPQQTFAMVCAMPFTTESANLMRSQISYML